MYTVATRENPARRVRALVAAFGVLGLSILLAGTLVHGRSTIPMGERITPNGWPISFQLPLGWSERRPDDDSIELIDAREPRNEKQLVLIRSSDPPDLPLAEIAAGTMSIHLAAVLGVAPRLTAEDEPLGALHGVRVAVPETGDYIHVGEVSPDGSEIIMLRYHAAHSFSRRDRNTYRRVVESVELINKR